MLWDGMCRRHPVSSRTRACCRAWLLLVCEAESRSFLVAIHLALSPENAPWSFSSPVKALFSLLVDQVVRLRTLHWKDC